MTKEEIQENINADIVCLIRKPLLEKILELKKENTELSNSVTELTNLKTELEKKVTELEKQIEKMKCCENCKHYIDSSCELEAPIHCKYWYSMIVNATDEWECIE